MKKCWFKPIKKSALFILGLTLIVSGAQTAGAAIEQKAVSINVAADYSAGAHSVISVDPVGGPREVLNNLKPTVSDLGLNANGRYFYVIERFFGDNVTKYDIAKPSDPIWQFSTMDENDEVASSNPHSMVFAAPNKAYILRHNDSVAWIVNPAAENQESFRTGYLDLSAYNDQDQYGPEMTNGAVVEGKLFIITQRMDQSNNWEPNDAYVAVFDTTTDKEIETGSGGEIDGVKVKGIKLPVKNPNGIQYDPQTGLIFVSGTGNYGNDWSGVPPDYSGGIVTIDPKTFATKLLVDDGDEGNHPYGNISGMTVLSPTKGYFTGYAGWGDNSVYEFNPTTGEVKGIANEYLKNKNIAGMNAGAYGDKNGMLWITNATDAEIVIINPADNSIDEKISTNLNPQKVVFVTYGAPDKNYNENGVAVGQEIPDGTVDLNGDGKKDVISEGYKFLETDAGAQIAMESGKNVNEILQIASVDDTSALADGNGDQPESLPFGLLDFSLSVQPGSQASVVVYLPETDVKSWFKYTKKDGWVDYTEHAQFTTMADGRTRVELTFEDGGFGDSDGKVNGIIVDPSGPGVAKSSGGGGSGGCFISSVAATGTTSSLAFVLMAGVLCALVVLLAGRKSRLQR